MRNDLSMTPWSDLNRVWNMMDRIWPTRDYELLGGSFPIDVYEQDGRIFVRASMPGVKPEDLNVSINQGVLTISGEIHDNFENRDGSRLYHREHTYGKLVRSVRIPSDVDENEVDAQLEQGILTVSVPHAKPSHNQPKKIEIRHDASKSAPGTKAYADRPKQQEESKATR